MLPLELIKPVPPIGGAFTSATSTVSRDQATGQSTQFNIGGVSFLSVVIGGLVVWIKWISSIKVESHLSS